VFPLHWVAVPLVMVLLSVLLIWGMRKEHRARAARMEEEIRSDDPPAEPPIVAPAMDSISSAIVEERRLLVELWGPDVPDLVVSLWISPNPGQAPIVNYQQFFLPFDEDLEGALASLESQIFDGAVDQGVPEKSRFLVSYTFVRLSHLGHDFAIRSSFVGASFVHEFRLADSDGKLVELPPETHSTVELTSDARWLARRRALVHAIRDGEGVIASELFRDILRDDPCDGGAYAWLGHIEQCQAGDRADIVRNLAMAEEFASASQVAQIERARQMGTRALRRWVRAVRNYIASRTDAELHGGFLLAQSLIALHQGSVARLLCEQLLNEYAQHPGAARLHRLINRKERGAQT